MILNGHLWAIRENDNAGLTQPGFGQSIFRKRNLDFLFLHLLGSKLHYLDSCVSLVPFKAGIPYQREVKGRHRIT